MAARKKSTKVTSDKPAAKGSGIKFLVSDDAYAKTVRWWKSFAVDIAAKIEAGDALDDEQARRVAGILRQWADSLSESQPRGPGQAPRFDPGSVAMMFIIMTLDGGMSRAAAQDKLAEACGVSREAIKEGLKKYEAEADRIFGRAIPLGRGRKPIR